MDKIKLLFALCIYLLVGCKKKEEPIPILTPIAEPSIVAHELSFADSEERGFLYYEAVTDTILERNTFDREYRLTAPKGYQNYEWNIDGVTLSVSKEHSVKLYPDSKKLGNLPIRLIVKGDVYERFPNGTNIDTVYKNLYILPSNKTKLKGKYTGTLFQFHVYEHAPNLNDPIYNWGTKTIEILEKPAPPFINGFPYLVITGLGEYAPCPDQEGLRLRWGYQSFSMLNSCGGRRYKGYGKLSAKNDSISFEYRPWEDSRWYRFIGKRIP
jgi:hypothetical protein